MKSSALILLLIMIVLTLISTVGGQAAPKKIAKDKKTGIDWKMSLQSALKEAERTDKVVMVDFWATWCAPCRAMDKRTYTNPGVLAQAKKFIMVKIDIEKAPDDALRYQVETPPNVLFLKADGSVLGKFVGFRNAADTIKSMKRALIESKLK